MAFDTDREKLDKQSFLRLEFTIVLRTLAGLKWQRKCHVSCDHLTGSGESERKRKRKGNRRKGLFGVWDCWQPWWSSTVVISFHPCDAKSNRLLKSQCVDAFRMRRSSSDLFSDHYTTTVVTGVIRKVDVSKTACNLCTRKTARTEQNVLYFQSSCTFYRRKLNGL